MPFGKGFNVFFFDDIGNFEWSIRSLAIGGMLLIGAVLCFLVVCLLLMVVTLSFDCWWTLGSFFNIDMAFLEENDYKNSTTKLIKRTSAEINRRNRRKTLLIANQRLGNKKTKINGNLPAINGQMLLGQTRQQNGEEQPLLMLNGTTKESCVDSPWKMANGKHQVITVNEAFDLEAFTAIV